MRTRAWLQLAILLCLAVPLPAAVNHIFLLDCSGSMRATYAAGLSPQVLSPLLRLPALFQPGSTVDVRCFSKSGIINFRSHDPQRRFDGRFAQPAVAAAWPTAASATGRFTSLPEALELGKQDLLHLSGLRHGTTLLWLLTDNIEDDHGSGNDSEDAFYLDLYRTGAFHHIDFFPFSFHGHPLVLYLIQANQNPPLAWGQVEAEVGKVLDAPPILFRPMQNGMLGVDANDVLWQSPSGAGAPLVPVNGGYELPPVREGQPLRGRIVFRIRSFSRDWSIRDAHLSRATLQWTGTPPLAPIASGSLPVAPRRLAVASQGRSDVEYSVDLGSGSSTVVPRRRSFWAGWNQSRTEMTGNLRFSAQSPDLLLQIANNPELTARIRAIHGLEGIERFMLPPSLSPAERQIHIALILRAPVTLSRTPLLIVGVAAGVLLFLAVVLVILLTRPVPIDLLVGVEPQLLLLRRWRRHPFPDVVPDHSALPVWFIAGWSSIAVASASPWQILDRHGEPTHKLFLRHGNDEFTLVHEDGARLLCQIAPPAGAEFAQAVDPFSPGL